MSTILSYGTVDRRTRPRILTQRAITVNGDLKVHCFDISYEGMYVHTEAEFNMYVHTEAEFKLNDVITLDFIIEGKDITAKASIRHIEPGFGFGAKFIEMNPDDKMLLMHLLPAESVNSAGLRIALLIADSGKNSPAYKYRLQQDQFSVIEATDGNEAFRVLQTTKPDIVILDSQIKGISASKILQFMKARTELREVPVIMFASGFASEEVERFHALGINDLLVRAVTPPNILSEKIKQLLGA